MSFLSSAPCRANILGVGISVIDMAGAVRLACDLVRSNGKGYISATGVHGIMVAQGDNAFREILNGSFLTLPDGTPTVWVGRQQGFVLEQVTGPDFILRLCEDGVAHGFRHFLYGGDAGVAEALREGLRRDVCGVEIVGVYTPPFRPLSRDEFSDLQKQISEAQADVLWIGLSTPKQERFMKEALDSLDIKLMVGVGAAFDFHTGRIRQSPVWVKKIGMQWLHRLVQDPRLWRRYLSNNPRFVYHILLQLLGIYHLDLPPKEVAVPNHT